MFWLFGHKACRILATWSGTKPAAFPMFEGEALTPGLPGTSQFLPLSQAIGEVLSRWQGLSLPSSAGRGHQLQKGLLSWRECSAWDFLSVRKQVVCPWGPRAHLSLPGVSWAQLPPHPENTSYFPRRSAKHTQAQAPWLNTLGVNSISYFKNALFWPQGEK